MGGYSPARITGMHRNTHQYWRSAPAYANGSVTAAMTSPTTSVIAMLTTLAVPLRFFGTSWSWARLTCAATAHTAPGTYLASCPRNMTRIAAGGGSGEPRSVRSARQASIMQPRPATTARTAPTTS